MPKKSGKSRPQNTSSIAQPVSNDAAKIVALSAFSPSAEHFAFLSLAVDKHRLRVYDCLTNQSIAEYTIDAARITSLTWTNIYAPESPPSKKKRRKQADQDTTALKTSVEVVALGLTNGTVLFFSPKYARVVQELSHPTSTSPIHAIHSNHPSNIWTCSADCTIALWKGAELAARWKTDSRVPYSSLALRRVLEDEEAVELLVAHHAIQLLSLSSDSSSTEIKKVVPTITFTGHASPVKSLHWDLSSTPPQYFFSSAQQDRFVSLWRAPQSGSTGSLVASATLDSDVKAVSLQEQTLLTVSASGKISIHPVPAEFSTPSTSKQKIPTLLPRSTISPPKKPDSVEVLNAAFDSRISGQIKVARVVGGARPVFDTVRFMDELGAFVAEVTLDEVSSSLASEAQTKSVNQRYSERPSTAVSSGDRLGHEVEMDDTHADGELDADIAELSLGQRLTAISGEAPLASDDEDEPSPQRSRTVKPSAQQELSVVPANSLTRTLIQALHSSDSRLLETCLAHSEPTLIRNTVRKLPSQLAVPLINACVDRLGRGARAATMKGGGGGASSQKGKSLVGWIRTVLIVHNAHLMTIPDLVARLSDLHATLTSRLALQESLLSLSGRLDMVLSQIELRSSSAPAPVSGPKERNGDTQHRQVQHYVEGESDEDEDEDGANGMEVDESEEEGSIEDIGLGGDSDENEEAESEEETDESEDEDGPTLNGFIDDEAEESEDEDDYSE